MNKKRIFVILICIISAIVVLVSATATYAIWQQNVHDSIYIKIPVEDENPSVKYQMFVPVKASGNTVSNTNSAYTRVSGSYTITNDKYSYSLTDETEISNIVGYAFVGWFGGVSLEYIEIPSEYTMELNGEMVTKPVVRAMVDKDFEDYVLLGDRILTKIIIGANVVEIDSGTFSGMQELREIVYKGEENSEEIYIKEMAFGYCIKLENVENHRNISENCDTTLIYMGSYA